MRNAQMPHLTACQYTGLHLQLVEKPTLWIFYLQLTSTQFHKFWSTLSLRLVFEDSEVVLSHLPSSSKATVFITVLMYTVYTSMLRLRS